MDYFLVRMEACNGDVAGTASEEPLSEVLEKAASEGPQTITRHGVEQAVVLSVEEYRRLKGPERTLVDLLLSGPKFDDFELPPREIDPPRKFSWDDDVEPAKG